MRQKLKENATSAPKTFTMGKAFHQVLYEVNHSIERLMDFLFLSESIFKRLLVTFYISVNLPFRVQILQALQNFPQYCSYVGLL